MSIDIDHLETLAREATEGPWHVRENGPSEFFVEAPGSPEMPYRLDVCGDDYVGHGDDEQRRRNWDFIAAADPDTVLALVARIREMEGREQALAAHVARLDGLLETSLNGLRWWRDAHPEDANEADYEHEEEVRRGRSVAPTTSLACRDERMRDLGMLQGGVVAAAMAAPWQEVMAKEILAAFGVHSGEDLDGAAEYDIAQLIENKVRIPGLHAAWQKARRAERREAEGGDQ